MMYAIAANRERTFSFCGFHLTPNRRLLAKDGKPVRLGSRALDLLIVLVENSGNVLAKSDLMLRVWGSVVVEEANLRVHISVLRRVLGDDGFRSRYIVHVARRGYIFVAPIDGADEEPSGYASSDTPVRRVIGASRSSTVADLRGDEWREQWSTEFA